MNKLFFFIHVKAHKTYTLSLFSVPGLQQVLSNCERNAFHFGLVNHVLTITPASLLNGPHRVHALGHFS